MPNRLWTRNELIVALNLYLKLPFGKLHSRTTEIVRLAELVGRTPSAVAMRLSNFASVDPFHQKRGVKGLPRGRHQVEPIWEEFYNSKEDLIFESETILADYEKQSLEEKFSDILNDITGLNGTEKIRETKTRINQHIFREIVLTNYCNRCAISGINMPGLLVSSHIIPWSKNEKERINPENGICLSSLYDRAFDLGLISLNFNYIVLLSGEIKENTSETWFQKYLLPIENQVIHLPMKYLPKKEFLEFHNMEIFKGL